MDKRKIILDCDPGHDDAVAITLAGINEKIDLLGITVVAGNQTLEKTSVNALNVCQCLGLDVPVYAGCGRPMIREKMVAADIHGETGLDGPVFEPLTKKLEDQHAVLYMIDTLMKSDGDITVVTTGPMTNSGNGDAAGAGDHPEDPGDRPHGRRLYQRKRDAGRRV